MSIDDYVWAAFVLYSIISPLLKRRAATRKPEPAAQAEPAATRKPAPSRASTPQPHRATRTPVTSTTAELATQTRLALEALVSKTRAFRAGLDAALEGALGPLIAREIEARSERLRADLERSQGDTLRLPAVARAVRDHQTQSSRLLDTLDGLARRRNDPAFAALTRTADRLIAAVIEPIRGRSTNPQPTPLALVTDDDPKSPLYANFILLPTDLLTRPAHWTVLASAIADWVLRDAEGLEEEIGAKLELVGDAGTDAGTERVSLVLFGEWGRTFMVDAIAAQLLGPAYLRGLASLLSRPHSRSVVQVSIAEDGVVQPEPPAHARVHVCAQWLARLGTPESALAATLREWDDVHDQPTQFHVTGAYAYVQLTVPDFLAITKLLLDQLEATPLTAIGGSRMSDLGGFNDHSAHSARVDEARTALAEQRPFPRHPRASVAAAIDAAVAAPEQASRINAWLVRSLSGSTEPVHERLRVGPAPRLQVGRGRISANQVAHALVLGELLLRPRHRHP